MTIDIGMKLGPYEVVAKLGEGGMGEVYLARDPRLERNVAIKVLPEHMAQNPESLVRFQYENKSVAALSHPNIRIIFDIGADKGYTFAVMEYLEGETLGELLEKSALKWQAAMKISLSIASGLAAAHSKGIVHRDIKPHNIFLTENGDVKILDFGLAVTDPKGPTAEKEHIDTTLTHGHFVESFAGTVSYMSPEQVRSEATDVRSDIFAFGTVLFEMLTGKRLFAKKTQPETTAAILYESPPSLQQEGLTVPAELQRLLNLCLEKEAANRIPTMTDIITKITGILKIGVSKKKKIHPASVAVIPFENMSSVQEDEYFSDGLTEELINSLVKIGGLHVASRTASAQFKGKTSNIQDIADQLSVKTIVEGSVRKSGNRVRITAQLINANDGHHLWSENFDRNVEDVFAVQSEIAGQIAQALHVVLTDKEKKAIAKAPTGNIKAYDFMLQGRQHFYNFQRKEFDRALSLFLHAAKLDPEFAEAYAWASYCYSFLYSWFNASEINLKEAETTSRKALKLDPELAEAHVSRGMALSLKKDIDAAQKEFETALRLKPDLYEAAYFYARNSFSQGNSEKAAELAEQATQLRPDDYSGPYLLGMIYTDMGREEEAKAAFELSLQRVESCLELFPDDARALSYGAGALNHLERKPQALEWTERAFAASPQEPMTLYAVACDFAMLGRVDKAVSCLERARLFGTLPKKWLENDPDLDSLRDRPRFKAFLAQLPDE